MRGHESDPPRETIHKGNVASSHRNRLQDVQAAQEAERIRKKFLDVATELFSKKGYEGTTISDITEALDMSKGSFYLYFRDKRELFIQCIDRLADLIVPQESWRETSSDKENLARQAKRGVAFLEAFPLYAGMLNLIKIAAAGDDDRLAHKAKEALARIVEPVVKEFRRAVTQGIIREVDEGLFACVVLGTAEYVGLMRMADPNYNLKESVDKCMDILAHGVLPQASAHPDTAEVRRPSGEITDVKGETVKVREISFSGKPYLTGRIGEGEIRIDIARVTFMLLDHSGAECTVKVTMTDGERTTLHQDGNLIVSAACSVGYYTIPFRNVRTISFA
jgi:AcrR family transcriptional regulator